MTIHCFSIAGRPVEYHESTEEWRDGNGEVEGRMSVPMAKALMRGLEQYRVEHHPRCSVCRSRHGSEKTHAAE